MSSDSKSNNNASDPVAEILREAGPRPAGPDLGEPPLDFESLGAPALAVWQAKIERRRMRRRQQLLVAAGLILGVAVVFLWRSWMPSTFRPAVGHVIAFAGQNGTLGLDRVEHGITVRAGQILRASAEPQRWLTVELTGGHRLRLDAGTELALISAEELDLLTGGVYIEATSGPLLVRAGEASARHIGTSYAVRHDSPGTVKVQVRHGRVQVRQADGSEEIKAAEQAVVTASGIEVSPMPTHGPEWDWTQHAVPPFDSDGATLEAVLQWIERESGLRVEVDPALLVDEITGEPVRVGGSLGGLSLEQILEVLPEITALEYRIEDGVLRVTAPAGP